MVISIESACSEQGGMTELTPILNSVHKPNDSLQRRRVLLIVVSSIEMESTEISELTEMTPTLNSVHTTNDS
jgi:hypothetical protein